MTIRTRFLLAFIGTILLIAGGVISYVAVQMRDDAESYYISSSSVELRLMNDYIEEFLKTAINNAAIAAKDTEFAGAGGIFPRYVEKDVETVFRVADLSPEARHLMEPLSRLDKDYDSYVEVYAGFADGSLVTTLDGLKFPAHFDMSKRPWYVARAGAAEDVGLADPGALPLAVACQQAVEFVGMPEGFIPLAETVVYLALARKATPPMRPTSMPRAR